MLRYLVLLMFSSICFGANALEGSYSCFLSIAPLDPKPFYLIDITNDQVTLTAGSNRIVYDIKGDWVYQTDEELITNKYKVHKSSDSVVINYHSDVLNDDKSILETTLTTTHLTKVERHGVSILVGTYVQQDIDGFGNQFDEEGTTVGSLGCYPKR